MSQLPATYGWMPESRPDDAMSTDIGTHAVELTILMPCLNEAETVVMCVSKALGFLQSAGIEGEVLIADNGSTDGSREIASARGARVVDVAERGYGAALSGGIAAARGRYVIMGDADDTYDFSSLTPFMDRLRDGHHLVMGNRFAGGIEHGAMPPLHRYLGNPVLSRLANVLFHSPVHDFHCGLRGFDAEAIRGLRLRTPGMEFASEMVVKARLAGLRLAEVPTTLSPGGRRRPPHLRTWRDGWRHLRFLLVYSPTWLFLYPGLALMLVGSTTMAALATGERHFGGLTFGVHTLLYSALALVVGCEAVGFARFVEFVGARSGELPRNRFFERLESVLTLERSIVIGMILVVAGVLGSVRALSIWSATGFGGLSPQDVMRVTIPSVAAVILGVQSALSAFFMYSLVHGPGRSD